jgi:hypothetical protein
LIEEFTLLPLARARFEALAGYIRRPETILFSEEMEWYASETERVIGVLIRDLTDNDFGGVVLGRDTRRRFRSVDLSAFSESRETARQLLRDKLELWSRRPDEDFSQGDERGTPMDVFVPAAASDRLSPSFVRVATGEGFSPTRALIESMMPYYEDVDGNFVEQFQTTAFDARFWELYIFALLNEDGFAFDRSFRSPDFLARRFRERIFVEAATVNPTINQAGLVIEPQVPTDPAAFRKYYQEYMPMKWGSALTSKLNKKYWELPHVTGNPIVHAIQDFHVPRAMTFLSHSITGYLYGAEFSALCDEKGNLIVKSAPRGSHKWGTKIIESGFFSLPNSEYISAVVTNPTATISKFNRMAHLAGFGMSSVRMICFGVCHDHDPNAAVPKPFKFLVTDPKYSETWVEGTNVFHNPKAGYPLDESFLSGAAHHRFEEGVLRSLIPEFHPYQSQTIILAPDRLPDQR